MRLHSLIPLLPQTLVDDLDSIGIRTDADLLLSTSPLDIFYRLPNSAAGAGRVRGSLENHDNVPTGDPNGITLLELKEYIELVSHRVSPPGQRADLLLASLHERAVRSMRCGVPAVDDLLAGLGDACVLEISGTRHAGKTVSIRTGPSIYDFIEAMYRRWLCK
jgi:RAD51-like protein 3